MSPRAADSALVVDLDGVLRIWDPDIVASAERRAGLPPGALDRAAFADAATLRAAVTGRISDAQWRAAIAARLVAVHGEAAAGAVADWSGPCGEVDRRVLAVLREQRRSRPVALLSNATDRLPRDLQRLGLDDEFDAVFNSSALGLASPTRRSSWRSARPSGCRRTGASSSTTSRSTSTPRRGWDSAPTCTAAPASWPSSCRTAPPDRCRRRPQDGGVPVPAPAPRLPRSVTWGLLAAWAVHDAEELVTMPGWADRARPRLERTVPRVPARVRDALSVSRPHATAAIGLVGAVVAAASARGARTDGADPLYQATLAGFGWARRPPRRLRGGHAGLHPGRAHGPHGRRAVRALGAVEAPARRGPGGTDRSRSGPVRASGRGRGARRGVRPAPARRPVAAGTRCGEKLRDPCRSGPPPFDVLVRGR